MPQTSKSQAERLQGCSQKATWKLNQPSALRDRWGGGSGRQVPHLCAVLQLELVEEGPGIPQVRVDLHGAVEPLPGLGDLPLAPEQPGGKQQGGTE